MGLALSLYEILTLDKRWNKTSGSKNWTTDVNGVVLERKKSQTKPYFPNCDRAHETKQEQWLVGLRKPIGSWVLRELEFVGRGTGEQKSWTSLESSILFLTQSRAVHTQSKCPWGLAVKSYRRWEWGSELSRDSVNKAFVEKLYNFTKRKKTIMNVWRHIPCLPGEHTKYIYSLLLNP